MKPAPSIHGRMAGEAEDPDGAGTPAARPDLTAAILAGPPLEREIRRALQGLRASLECTPTSGLLIARIESSCPHILILDLDITPFPEDLARFARSLRPDVRIVSAQWYWADREAPSFADAVVHKPARREEWFPAIAQIELSLFELIE